jgi:streptogrisin C
MKRTLAIGAAVLAVTGFAVRPADAAPPKPVLDPVLAAPLDPAKVQGSISYLMSEYHVSEAEALRRLQLQRNANILTQRFMTDNADVYSGMWIDQANGGVLQVGLTDTSKLSYMLARVPDTAHIKPVQMRKTRKELVELEAHVQEQLGISPVTPDLTTIDERNNQVVVLERGWLKPAPGDPVKLKTETGSAPTAEMVAQAARGTELQSTENVKNLALNSGGFVRVQQVAKPEPQSRDFGECHPLACAPNYGPMQGGLRLDIERDPGQPAGEGWGGCTSGYNMRSRGGGWNNWLWVLTAGHCVMGPKHTHADLPYHNGQPLLVENNRNGMEVNTYPYDFAAMNYYSNQSVYFIENASAKNLVLSYCRWLSNDQNAGCTSAHFGIRGRYDRSQIHNGFVACASGAGASLGTFRDIVDSGAGPGYFPGTRCGSVQGDDGGVVMNICSRSGDSGGPLFSEIDNMAYGILEGNFEGIHRSGPCVAGEMNNYTPISRIWEWMYTYDTNGSLFDIIMN